ncbi:acyl carrier protein [Buchnera aphidicola (Taiwanaphis decaspermi)]|uniref:acyl carrier protein n=1 Tax=Buchnera aphidicola TaxID=9 RepID=UPI0031B8956B
MKIIENKIKKIISEQLGIEIKNINNDSYFVKDLGADSLDMIELIMSIEEKFNIEISDKEAQNMNCINKIVEYLNKIKYVKT